MSKNNMATVRILESGTGTSATYATIMSSIDPKDDNTANISNIL
jgi:hypothetical protein